MSGVGSTNAMKKGSANNPFLAYSEADMASFLNSAYTGCIVKYAGEPISRYLTEQNKIVPEHVKNLVFSLVDGGFWTFFNSGNIRIKIQQKTNGSTKTLYITPGRYYNGAWHFDKLSFTNSNLYLTDSLTAPTEIPIAIQEYFSTEPHWRWNKECINDQGNLTVWTYDQDVTFTIEQATTEYGIAYDSTHGITIVPYKVNELYKVVYGDGKYYYEEFYHISDTRTTANSDYIAPGKTAFDFTGNLQTGNGSKINPYLAYTVAEFQSFPVGSFIKWLGPDRTVLDETTGQMLIQGEVYRAVEDGDIFQYVILPTLSNPADPIDVAEGKEVINQLGAVMIGTGNVVLRAATTEGMQALFTTENIGKVVQYVGETDVYIKDAFYLITTDASAKQYYELPELTNEGTSSDLAQGKELINSKGEKVVGTVSGGVVEIITGSITTSSNTLTIAGILRKPKIISMYNNSITSSKEWCGCFSDPSCAVEGENTVAVKWLKGSSGPSRGFVYSYFVYNADTQTVTFSPTGASFSKSPLDYAIAY